MGAVRIVRREGHRGAVLEIRGAVDLGTVDAIKARLQELLAHPSPVVEVDLHFVDFLDSSGVSMLLSQFQSYCVANKVLYLTRASRNIRRTLTILKLDFLLSDPTHDARHADCVTL